MSRSDSKKESLLWPSGQENLGPTAWTLPDITKKREAKLNIVFPSVFFSKVTTKSKALNYKAGFITAVSRRKVQSYKTLIGF